MNGDKTILDTWMSRLYELCQERRTLADMRNLGVPGRYTASLVMEMDRRIARRLDLVNEEIATISREMHDRS